MCLFWSEKTLSNPGLENLFYHLMGQKLEMLHNKNWNNNNNNKNWTSIKQGVE